MVARQIAARGIRDETVLAVMRRVPRHEFVPPDQVESAYEDRPLGIGSHQTISQPYMVALMTSVCRLTGMERALEIGTGSGYQTAILASLAKEVFTVERLAELSQEAEKRLLRLRYANISYLVGDGTLGWPQHAPYDVILVTAGAPAVPEALKQQLAQGGRLVIPEGDRYTQTLSCYTKIGASDFRCEDYGACVFVPLVGMQGWEE